ncbi:MAG: glycosyltransferase family 9 protein [Saprospiraceae bacterium]|nr:glycosyltransferase family 9 protein [Saprospiraceae bacterium]MBP9744160.1 glycosyltransferase family 9 protein [Saprospiraceae bacterium]
MLKKVLVIRLSSLGDIVLTTLAVRCLKTQTNCEVHYLTKSAFKDLLVANPYIEKIWLLESSLGELVPSLKAEGFDLILDLHNNLRSRLIRLRLWQVPVVTYHKGNLAKWLAVYFKIIRLPKDHIAIRYLESLKKYLVEDDGQGLDYFIPEKDKVDLKTIAVQSPYIALVIGAAHFTKRIPVEKLQVLTADLATKWPIVIIGGKAEEREGKLLESDRVINTCGRYSISQSASLLAQSFMVIAPDTGMMHIAAALKKPIRSVWGSTLAEFGFWPFYGAHFPDLNQSFEVSGLNCRPCARFGRDHCPKGHFDCMQQQDVNKIILSI